MATNIPYSHSSTPILEGWLIKALRLAHSKKPEDLEKLRKLYKDACTDDAQVSRITVAEALREQPSDAVRPDSQERETTQPTNPRIRPVLVINTSQQQQQQHQQHQQSSSDTTASPLSQPASGPSTSVPTTTGPVVVPKPASTNASAKRTKVAFFNMFDPISSSGTPSSTTLRIATPPVVQRTTTPTPTPPTTSDIPSVPSAPVVVDLTDSGSSNDTPGKAQPGPDLPTVLPWTTATTTSADSANPSVIDLTCSPGQPPLEQPQQTASSRSAPDAQLVASLVADLACCACGKLTRPPQLEPDGLTMNANMLVECVQCGALYHQMCHQPPVLSAQQALIQQQQQQQWRCANCAPPSSGTLDVVESHVGVGARKRKGGIASSAATYAQGGASKRL